MVSGMLIACEAAGRRHSSSPGSRRRVVRIKPPLSGECFACEHKSFFKLFVNSVVKIVCRFRGRMDTLTVEHLIGWDGLLREDERQVRASVRRVVRELFLTRIVADYEAGRFAVELVPAPARLGLLGADLQGSRLAGRGAAADGLACPQVGSVRLGPR